MKTRILITAAFIFSLGMATTSAGSQLTFTTSNGIELTQPIMPDVEEEQLPEEVKQLTAQQTINLAYYHFDLSSMTKPEEEEELPFDLGSMFKQAMKTK